MTLFLLSCVFLCLTHSSLGFLLMWCSGSLLQMSGSWKRKKFYFLKDMLCLQKTRFLKYWETQVTASSPVRLFKKTYLSIDEKELLGRWLTSRLLFSLLIKLICCIKTSETYFIIRKRWYNIVQNNFRAGNHHRNASSAFVHVGNHPLMSVESSKDFSRLWTGGEGTGG